MASKPKHHRYIFFVVTQENPDELTADTGLNPAYQIIADVEPQVIGRVRSAHDNWLTIEKLLDGRNIYLVTVNGLTLTAGATRLRHAICSKQQEIEKEQKQPACA